jgi:hypothetical protein
VRERPAGVLGVVERHDVALDRLRGRDLADQQQVAGAHDGGHRVALLDHRPVAAGHQHEEADEAADQGQRAGAGEQAGRPPGPPQGGPGSAGGDAGVHGSVRRRAGAVGRVSC